MPDYGPQKSANSKSKMVHAMPIFPYSLSFVCFGALLHFGGNKSHIGVIIWCYLYLTSVTHDAAM